MSSNRRSISACDSPSSEPLRKMLSRPDSSGWNPAPSSSMAARLPRTRISPEVGFRMPATHLSRVDFPQPLRPRMPKVSPSLMSTLTSWSAQKGV